MAQIESKSVPYNSALRPGPKGAMSATSISDTSGSIKSASPIPKGAIVDTAALDFDFLASSKSNVTSLKSVAPDTSGDDFDDFDAVFVSASTTAATTQDTTPTEDDAVVSSRVGEEKHSQSNKSRNDSEKKYSDTVTRFLKSLPDLSFVLE
jgi:hypothetical protein